jgi:SAM-dependent methyltransferase
MTDLPTQAAANAAHWDASAEKHFKRWYRLEEFKAGTSSLDEIQRAEVGPVAGKDLLHLQCNAGIDTLSWARLGAQATGVDLAAKPLDQARLVARECGIDAKFIQADVFALPAVLDGRFDIVYTSQGVLCWIGDLQKWASAIRRCLNPGGFLYLMEEHPLAVSLDEVKARPEFGDHYFNQGGPENDGTTYQSTWSLGEVVNALIGTGLRLDFLNEYPKTFYQRLPYMEKTDIKSADCRWWHIPGYTLPLMYTLKATLP